MDCFTVAFFSLLLLCRSTFVHFPLYHCCAPEPHCVITPFIKLFIDISIIALYFTGIGRVILVFLLPLNTRLIHTYRLLKNIAVHQALLSIHKL